MTEYLKKLPFDRWQTPKEILRIFSNLFSALFVAQAFGVDLSKFGVSPAISLWVSGALAAFFLGLVMYISNHQDRISREDAPTPGS